MKRILRLLPRFLKIFSREGRILYNQVRSSLDPSDALFEEVCMVGSSSPFPMLISRPGGGELMVKVFCGGRRSLMGFCGNDPKLKYHLAPQGTPIMKFRANIRPGVQMPVTIFQEFLYTALVRRNLPEG